MCIGGRDKNVATALATRRFPSVPARHPVVTLTVIIPESIEDGLYSERDRGSGSGSEAEGGKKLMS